MSFIGFTALVALAAIGSVLCEDETIGPIFMKEPANRVDFSNTTLLTQYFIFAAVFVINHVNLLIIVIQPILHVVSKGFSGFLVRQN